ncbi:MAG: hypothetical protein JWM77_1244 [Rhodospirillales bacterium]|nr:hypothetical protein [Rhodospirillales bacterium]
MYKHFFAAVVTLSAATAVAANNPSSPTVPIVTATPNATADPPTGIMRASSLADAVTRIEERIGGRTMEIRWLHGPGRGYEALVSPRQDEPVIYVRLNPLTDRITVLRVEALPQSSLPWKALDNADMAWKATVPLGDALRAGEQYYNGTVLNAAITKPRVADTDLVAYQMDMWVNGALKSGAVNAVTGNVIRQRDVEVVYDPRTLSELMDKQVGPSGPNLGQIRPVWDRSALLLRE